MHLLWGASHRQPPSQAFCRTRLVAENASLGADILEAVGK